MNMLLKGLAWRSGEKIMKGDIRIQNGLISEIGYALEPSKRERNISFDNHFVYPGLINSHDHLEMNLYPRLGNPPYHNYIEWGNDTYKPKESPIKEIEKVSFKDRLLWGGVKNLISGVTTVVHHNPWNRFLSTKEFPVRVLKKYSWAHSLGFGKDISKSFPNDSKVPFIIHAAEGVDEIAYNEVNKLSNLGLLKKNTVLIHAVALTIQNITMLQASKSSIVWCPSSNYFLFNKTAPIRQLKKLINIALGSDSTLTGLSTFLDEIRFASQTKLASTTEIYNQVTLNPSLIFGLPKPSIDTNKQADLFILPIAHEDYAENLIHSYSSDMELVLLDGDPKFCSESIAKELGLKRNFANVNGSTKWFCLDVHQLKKRIQKVTGNVVEASPLWKLID